MTEQPDNPEAVLTDILRRMETLARSDWTDDEPHKPADDLLVELLGYLSDLLPDAQRKLVQQTVGTYVGVDKWPDY